MMWKTIQSMALKSFPARSPNRRIPVSIRDKNTFAVA